MLSVKTVRGSEETELRKALGIGREEPLGNAEISCPMAHGKKIQAVRCTWTSGTMGYATYKRFCLNCPSSSKVCDKCILEGRIKEESWLMHHSDQFLSISCKEHSNGKRLFYCNHYKADISYERCLNTCTNQQMNKGICTALKCSCHWRLCSRCADLKPEGFSFLTNPDTAKECATADVESGLCIEHADDNSYIPEVFVQFLREKRRSSRPLTAKLPQPVNPIELPSEPERPEPRPEPEEKLVPAPNPSPAESAVTNTTEKGGEDIMVITPEKFADMTQYEKIMWVKEHGDTVIRELSEQMGISGGIMAQLKIVARMSPKVLDAIKDGLPYSTAYVTFRNLTFAEQESKLVDLLAKRAKKVKPPKKEQKERKKRRQKSPPPPPADAESPKKKGFTDLPVQLPDGNWSKVTLEIAGLKITIEKS